MELETGAGKVLPVYIEEEMQKSYIDYAMSVIVQRALPDVRDGLKPVHRRILYAMQEAGMASNKPYKKSARIVGEVLGKYHPHGDSSIYETLVVLSQDFKKGMALVDGHGNFGSIEGDGAAAMRYTEAKLKKFTQDVYLADLDKDIIDFVPNHVARQYHSDAQYNFIEELGQNDNTSKAFDPNNNFYYIPGQPLTLPFTDDDDGLEYSEFPAKATGNDRFDAFPNCNDWYETVKLNYGVDYLNGRSKHFDPIPNTWNKMLDILRFWASKKIDGFRCDMAEMVPVEFWEWAIPLVKKDYPVIFIAEVYNPAEYRNYIFNGHFDYLYDKVGLYDTLRAVICGQAPASNIPACWQSLEGIQAHMLNFLENHDEQRLASDFFAKEPLAGISGLIVSALMNTNPMMIYAGQELGERGMDEEGFSGLDGRTTIFDYWSVSTLRNWKNGGKYDGGKLTEKQKQLRQQYATILNIAKNEPAINQGAFFDLMYTNEKNRFFNNRNQYAFLRKHKNEVILVVANFTHFEQNVWVNIPEDAFKTLGIKDNEAAMLKDLLTGTETIRTLTTAWPFKVKLPACSGKVLKFTY